MDGWLISLIVKPFAAMGFLHINGKVHELLHKHLPDGKLKTLLLRDR